MRLVNLLPESYFRQIARRSAFRRNAAVAVVLLVVIVGGVTTSQLQARQVHRRVVFEQQRLNQEQEQGRDLAKLTAQHGNFRASEDLVASLEEPVPMVAILAALSRAVPEEVVLNRLVVDAPNDRGADAGATNKSAVARNSGTAKSVGRPLAIELGGMAHSDREVVRCLSRLAEQPLFSNVKLGKSRHVQDTRNSTVAFQITLEVPLNRDIVVSGKDESHGN